MTLATQAGILLAVFGAVTLAALALGAANLGTAMGVGQIAFVAVLVWMLLKR